MRRRHNPAIAKSLGSAVGVAVGVLGTQIVPPLLGLSGALPDAFVSLGIGLAARAVNKDFGNNVMIGGLASVLVDLVRPYLPGGSGLGFYVNNGFPLPTTGSGPYLLNAGYAASTPQMNGGM